MKLSSQHFHQLTQEKDDFSVLQFVSGLHGTVSGWFKSLSKLLTTCVTDQESEPVIYDETLVEPATQPQGDPNSLFGICAHSKEQAPVPVSPTCRFCGAEAHERAKCPARSVYCDFCKKQGHYRSVCERLERLQNNPSIQCSAFSPSLACSTIPVSVNGIILQALVDTGSTFSFIHSDVVRRLKLPCTSHVLTLSLASTNKSICSSSYSCISELKINGFVHKNFKLSVLEGLCSDIIIGHDLLSKHENVVVTFGGTQPAMVIDQITPKDSHQVCSVSKAKIDPPPLFHTLQKGCTPIICKSRPYSEDDLRFIRKEIAKLKEAGIVEDSNSPWRAQVLVTSESEHHRKRLVIDYSRTVNKFTHVDAYPLPRAMSSILGSG